jgi:hypothetical protein
MFKIKNRVCIAENLTPSSIIPAHPVINRERIFIPEKMKSEVFKPLEI